MDVAVEPHRDTFPYRAVFILAMCLTVNGYTLMNLFPYVGMMVQHLMGLPTTNESGYYAGYIASSFTFGRFLSGYLWGYVSDYIGRKPVIIIGLSGIAVLSIFFGCSTNLAWAITSRLILGLLNGIVPAVRTTAYEVCGPEHVVMGMAFLSGAKGVALILGTGVGGLLAQPALNYPDTFSATGFWAKYPFVLPNVVGACFALFVLPFAIFYIPETRKSSTQSAEKDPPSTEVPGKLFPQTGQTPKISSKLRPKKRGRRSGYTKLLEGGADGKKQLPRQYGHATVEEVDEDSGIEETGNADRDDTAVVLGSGLETKLDARVRGNEDRESRTINSEGSTPTSARPSSSYGSFGDPLHPRSGKLDLGLCGSYGLLAIPGVKVLLLMVCLVQMASIGFEEVYPLWALSTPNVGGLGWNTKEIGKVMSVAGGVLVPLQLVMIPLMVKKIGPSTCQRIGCLVALPTFLAIPCAKLISWDDTSLFIVSVQTNLLVAFCIAANMIALTIASTTMVPKHQRGKLSGIFITAESLGRFTGPVLFSTVYAWSISPSSWADHHFVFLLPSSIMVVVGLLAWRNFNKTYFDKT